MNKREIEKILIEAKIEPNEAKIEAELLLEHIFNKTREEICLIEDFDKKDILPFLNERIKTRRPIQYILNSAYFMGRKFYVNENCLIPRDETEILVRNAHSHIKNKSKILDIGTGSGIIACMLGLLAKNLHPEILGVDISSGAINVALTNMKKFSLQGVCLFRKSDIFSNINSDEKFDIIVSNPPYIPQKLKNNLQKELSFEPEIALFTNDDKGIYFYEKIIAGAKKYLKENGKLLFEIMEGQNKDIRAIFSDYKYKNIQSHKDLSGIYRTIEAEI